MNKLKGNITNVEMSGNLAIVSVEIEPEIVFKAIIIEHANENNYLKIGNLISVLFKETEVIIATEGTQHISLQNKILSSIKHIEQGILLSKLTLQFDSGEITSIISTNAVKQLALSVNKKVTAMVKLNEVMLSGS